MEVVPSRLVEVPDIPLAYFAGVDRSLTGYEGLIAAQECIPNNALRDAFAAEFNVLARIWEALSPDPVVAQYEADYRWLAQVYESLKPSTGTGRLLWHQLGAKTIELIHANVHVDAVRDDLDTLVLDADLLEAVLGNPDQDKKAKEISIKLAGRLRKHSGHPKFKALAERLEDPTCLASAIPVACACLCLKQSPAVTATAAIVLFKPCFC